MLMSFAKAKISTKMIVAITLLTPLPLMGASLDPPTLSIAVACTGNPTCIFTGSDIPLEITVKNNQSDAIGFPLRYLQARGPAMKLIDNVTRAQKTLKIGLANHDWMVQFTTLAPGEALTITSVIKASELTSLRKEYVDLTAEIGITINVKVPGSEEPVKYKGSGRAKIIGKDTLDRDQHVHLRNK